MRRSIVVLLLLALAGVTMGQDSCSTETGGGEPTATEASSTEREQARERKRERARERKREKRREKRRRARERRRAAQPAPLPDPAPSETVPAEPQDDCHPSYRGDCLDPGASDYDCAGGSGDGPEYANGPIEVVGDDEYDLDRDGDGTACES